VTLWGVGTLLAKPAVNVINEIKLEGAGIVHTAYKSTTAQDAQVEARACVTTK